MRVAVWPTDEVSPVDQVIVDRIQNVADDLARLGAQVSDTARPEFSPLEAHYTYANLLLSFVQSNLPDEEFERAKAHAASFAADDTSPEAMEARASVLNHRGWLRNDGIRHQWQAFFENWDVLLCPISVTTAFPHDTRPLPERTITVNGAPRPYFEQLFWAGIATMPYLPSTVFPAGPAPDGLPIGLQAIGAEYADYTTIEFARLMAQEFGGFTPPPAFAA